MHQTFLPSKQTESRPFDVQSFLGMLSQQIESHLAYPLSTFHDYAQAEPHKSWHPVPQSETLTRSETAFARCRFSADKDCHDLPSQLIRYKSCFSPLATLMYRRLPHSKPLFLVIPIFSERNSSVYNISYLLIILNEDDWRHVILS